MYYIVSQSVFVLFLLFFLCLHLYSIFLRNYLYVNILFTLKFYTSVEKSFEYFVI